MKLTPPFASSVLAAALVSGAALASGNQPGGHDHDHDRDAIGKPGLSARVSRTIRFEMSDAMRFTPSSVNVKQGETVRFVVKNSGQIQHEMVLGTEKVLKEHDEAMKKFPAMEHAEPQMVSVPPGKTGEIVWQFSQAGTIDFACLQPGHYEAGMKGTVKVTGKAGAPNEAAHAGHRH